MINRPRTLDEALGILGLGSYSGIIKKLDCVSEKPSIHGEGTTGNHLRLLYDNLPEIVDEWLITVSLLHDLGKCHTLPPNHEGHEQSSSLLAGSLPEVYPDREKIIWIIENHGVILKDPEKIRENPHYPDCLLFHYFDSISMNPPRIDNYERLAAILRMESPCSTVAIHLTSTCNLECEHCYAPDVSMDDISLEHISGILRDLCILGRPKVVLFGGEPFLRQDLSQIVHLCKSYGLLAEVVTNGTLADRKSLEGLRDAGLQDLCISIDGTKETHDKVRGSGTYNAAMTALREARLCGYNLRVNTVVRQSNKEVIPDLIREVAPLTDIHKLLYFTPFGRGEWMEWIPPEEWTSLIHLYASTEHQEKLRVQNPYDTSTRSCSFENPVILSNGRVYPCVLFLNSPYSCGNVLNERFLDIWRRQPPREVPHCRGYSFILEGSPNIHPEEYMRIISKIGCPLVCPEER